MTAPTNMQPGVLVKRGFTDFDGVYIEPGFYEADIVRRGWSHERRKYFWNIVTDTRVIAVTLNFPPHCVRVYMQPRGIGSSLVPGARGQRAACAPTSFPSAARLSLRAATSPGVYGRRGLCLSRGV